MPTKEEILSFVRKKGTAIPNDIRKELGGDTFLIGAMLSEMSKDGLIKVSHTKIGSSPSYYATGNESRLQDLIKYHNEKDRTTIELLKSKKILRDREQELLIRVSLRNVKDFAKYIEVKIKGEKEVFWKWYLTPMDEAEQIIRKYFAVEKTAVKKDPIPESTEEKSVQQEVKKEEFKQETITKEPVTETKTINDDFLKSLHEYFESKNIVVLEKKILRKNSDIELRITIPSAVGKVEYFCKAKNKKKCNDGDLSSAYLKGQVEKVPVLFITTGEITKKAENMLGKEFKGLVVKQL